MGNAFYGLCGNLKTKSVDYNNEVSIERDMIESMDPERVKQSVEKIQSHYKMYRTKTQLSINEENQLKEFDENVLNYGKFVTDKDLDDQIHGNIKKIEVVLKPFKLGENKTPKYKHVFLRGPIKFNDGSIYSGQWNYSGKKQGLGIYIKPDGSKYEGLWFDDKINGVGRFIDTNGNYYQGEWKNGLAEGKGILVAQGSRYEGNWVNDVQEGYGEEFYADGTIYKGEYLNGQKHGNGKFYWSDGSFYEGNFINSTISGRGVLHWKDGREYIGDWQNNKMHGSGTFLWPDGKKYIGNYSNDKKEGYGTYYWSSEKYYEGEWLNSKQHGEGKLMIRGILQKGQFRFGKLIKKDDNAENNLFLKKNGSVKYI